jgi:hypothetical protein
LKENGVKAEGITFDEGARTALAFVTLRADGEREFMFYRNPSADMLLKPEELNLELIRSVRSYFLLFSLLFCFFMEIFLMFCFLFWICVLFVTSSKLCGVARAGKNKWGLWERTLTRQRRCGSFV